MDSIQLIVERRNLGVCVYVRIYVFRYLCLYSLSLLREVFRHSLEYSSSLTEKKLKFFEFVVKFNGNLNDKGLSGYYI